MGLIANAIARLLRGRAVIAEPVRLYDKPKIGPEEVDFEAVQTLLCQRQGQACLANLWQEPTLQIRVRQPERPPIKQLAESSHPALTAVGHERRTQCFGIDQIKAISLVDRSLERTRRRLRSQIDQRLYWTGHRDAMTEHASSVGKLTTMDDEVARATPSRRCNRDLDASALGRNPPERCRTGVAQNGPRPTGKNGGHPFPMPGEISPSHGIYPTPYAMQPTPGNSVLNRLTAQSRPQQLPMSNHPMLPTSQTPQTARRLTNW